MRRPRLLSTGVRLYGWLLLAGAAAVVGWFVLQLVADDVAETVGLLATVVAALILVVFLAAIRWAARLSKEGS